MNLLKINKIVGVAFMVALAVLPSCSPHSSSYVLQPVNLRTEYKTDPFTDVAQPRLSWELISDGYNQVQTAYEIRVASDAALLATDSSDMWNSGKVESNKTSQVVYSGKPLASTQECFWQVRAWDKDGIAGPWSDIAKWEMGLLEWSDWKADWIAYDVNGLNKNDALFLPPVPYFRTEVHLDKPIKKARLYVTAFGVYDFFINGQKVGDWQLAPGWTNYAKRVNYQVFDVTRQLVEGDNALGAMVAKGWYAGYVGFARLSHLPKERAFYGELEKLKAQLLVEYADGSTMMVPTNARWKASTGGLLESDILMGETFDARLEPDGWKQPGFDDKDWQKVVVYKGPEIELNLHPGNPISYLMDIQPKTIVSKEDGSYLLDMGQNFAGVVSLHLKGNVGQKITLKYGEMLHPDGRLMTENLREARATDTYILLGDENGESWTPQFTYHGFRYVQVYGLSEKPTAQTITGKVMGSATPAVGTFVCSDTMVNQLYSNIVWTQRSNFIDIPTDCPQRDERMGWTGDAQVYIQSATYNTDIAAFYTKWLVDLNDDQLGDGTYPNYAPAVFYIPKMEYSPGWGEAGIICPWQLYKSYGDTRIIETFWDNMEAFMQFHIDKAGVDFLHEEGSFAHIYPKGGFSDWLSVGKKTAPELLTSMYFAYCAGLMAEMAQAFHQTDRADYYAGLKQKVSSAIAEHYWDTGANRFTCDTLPYGNGKGYVDGSRGFTGHTQTAYANAIYMGILSGDKLEMAYKNLAGLIEQNGNKLATGFLGIKQLLPSITLAGRGDLAYTLLLNREYPSWGFEIDNGATTIWERWNSYTKENGFVEGMNSFSHYAFGSVNEWLFNYMAGIRNAGVGYDSIRIEPVFDERIDYVKAGYHSINGLISSAWARTGSDIILNITLPVNTRAEVVLPEQCSITIIEPEGVNIELNKVSGNTLVSIGSGKYKFSIN